MLEAAFWGFVGGVALLVGAVAGLRLPAGGRLIGLIMGFGAGVLTARCPSSSPRKPSAAVARMRPLIGFATGALTFFVGDWIIDRRGGEHRKRSGGQQEPVRRVPSCWAHWSTASRSRSPSA